MDDRVELGPIYSDSWLRDPKHLVFALSRYKFVAKMLADADPVAEVGAGDGWASAIVEREVVGEVDCYDVSPLKTSIRQHDIMFGPLPEKYEAIYAIDIFEHVKSGEVFFRNLTSSLLDHGKLIVGSPSLEGQTYASEPSRKLHINCMSGEALRDLALRFFRHVFMFSMNDEVVHTGFMPMAHYLFAVCAEPIR
jgi:hypothetical protein